MILIAGVELTQNSLSDHRSAHVLGLGIHKYVPADGDPAERAREVRSQGGLAIAAHPVSTRKVEKQTYHLWDRRHELEREFDAWEIASGPYLFEEVIASGLPRIASSDLHRPEQIRSWKTLVDAELSEEAILDAVRRQRISFTFHEL